MTGRQRADITLTTVLVLGGVAAMIHGLHSIYPPLAWLFVGAVSLLVAVWPAEAKPKGKP